MNFWRASIITAILMVMALGPGYAENGSADGVSPCQSLKAFTELEVKVAAGAGIGETESGNCYDSAPAEDQVPKLRKRARKCWRLERYVRVCLTEAWNAPPLIFTAVAGCDPIDRVPAAADLLFIAGGYARVFQKG